VRLNEIVAARRSVDEHTELETGIPALPRQITALVGRPSGRAPDDHKARRAWHGSVARRF
jgi:hypothetical protein